MSFDLVVISSSVKLSDKAADKIYEQICKGENVNVTQSQSIADLYKELTAKHPEINDVSEVELDNLDLCPWTIAMHRSEGHLIINAVWSKAEYVSKLVHDLAHKYGVAVYNPQSGHVTNPREEK